MPVPDPQQNQLGIPFDNKAEMNEAFKRFKELADKKREIYDEDLQALVSEVQMGETRESYRLISLDVSSKTGRAPHAALVLRSHGNDHEVEADGDGPVDAVFKAIEKIAQSRTDLKLYSVNAITTGTDSQGEVTVRLAREGRIVNGQGSDTDILVASAKAYLNALNIMESPDRLHPQLDGV